MTSEPTKWYKAPEGRVEEQHFDQEQMAEITKDEVEDEVLEAVEEAKEEKKPPKQIKKEEKKKKADPSLVRELRRFDHVTQKTCACCAKRVPLASIQHGKAEECDDCRE